MKLVFQKGRFEVDIKYTGYLTVEGDQPFGAIVARKTTPIASVESFKTFNKFKSFVSSKGYMLVLDIFTEPTTLELTQTTDDVLLEKIKDWDKQPKPAQDPSWNSMTHVVKLSIIFGLVLGLWVVFYAIKSLV